MNTIGKKNRSRYGSSSFLTRRRRVVLHAGLRGGHGGGHERDGRQQPGAEAEWPARLRQTR